MMTNNQLAEAIERYLGGQMDSEELARFDDLRRQDTDIDMKIDEHRQFLGVLKQYRERIELVDRLNAIHDEIDVHELVEEMTSHPSLIVRLWRQHHSKISVAASIAIFAMLTTMFFTGYFGAKSKYQEMSAVLNKVKTSTDKLDKKTDNLQKQIITNLNPKKHLSPGNYKGSGFALSSTGYIVTNYHVVGSSYDSIYVQSVSGEAYRAKVVYTEPRSDIAILKISDASFKGLPALPYNFKKSRPDLGEAVYTIGYSEGDSPVFDQGYLSSSNGLQGDSLYYRVSISVNPGNSGGPLLNSKGNIIGIVSGRQAQTEGASYAVKTGYLYKALQNIPADSLANKLSMTNKNVLANISRVQQIKKMQNYVFMVRVY